MTERDPKHVARVEAFCAADKEKNIRMTYPLDSDSIVMDVGAYDGAWAREMHKRYSCTVYCFEPVQSCFAKLNKNVGHIEKIHLLNVGLKNKTGFTDIYVDGDASSLYNIPKGPYTLENIQVMSAVEAMEEFNKVALLKMNIEGDEYEVLDALIEADMIKRFDHIQIQFHRDIPDYIARRDKIAEHFKKTHKRDWNYDFVWESWSRK